MFSSILHECFLPGRGFPAEMDGATPGAGLGSRGFQHPAGVFRGHHQGAGGWQEQAQPRAMTALIVNRLRFGSFGAIQLGESSCLLENLENHQFSSCLVTFSAQHGLNRSAGFAAQGHQSGERNRGQTIPKGSASAGRAVGESGTGCHWTNPLSTSY